MEEIMEFVLAEIKNSGFEDKLVAGIVVTGGGSQLQHMKQCVEYVTGIDTRIGLPGEHLASGLVDEVNFPMFATGTGLVIMGLEAAEQAEHRPHQISPRKQQFWLFNVQRSSSKPVVVLVCPRSASSTK